MRKEFNAKKSIYDEQFFPSINHEPVENFFRLYFITLWQFEYKRKFENNLRMMEDGFVLGIKLNIF